MVSNSLMQRFNLVQLVLFNCVFQSFLLHSNFKMITGFGVWPHNIQSIALGGNERYKKQSYHIAA